jgi:hypothetical protein
VTNEIFFPPDPAAARASTPWAPAFLLCPRNSRPAFVRAPVVPFSRAGAGQAKPTPRRPSDALRRQPFPEKAGDDAKSLKLLRIWQHFVKIMKTAVLLLLHHVCPVPPAKPALGSVEMPPSVADRIAFWKRVGAAIAGNRGGAVIVPMPKPEGQG